MARPKKVSPDTTTKEAASVGSEESNVLASLTHTLAVAGFDQKHDLKVSEPGMAAALVWGRHEGAETRRVLALVLPPGAWNRSNADDVAALSWTLPPSDTAADHYPQFAVVKDAEGKLEAVFDVTPGTPHQIDKLPGVREINDYERIKVDPTYRWSMRMYDRLMKGFNALHERIYQTHKDRVNGKNDIIEEVAKLLFLESFRLHHPPPLSFEHEGRTLDLMNVFSAAYVKAHGRTAVAEIRSAFSHFKLHPDYIVTDDAGEEHPIFDRHSYLRLEQPGNYEAVLSLIQDLGPVTDNRNQVLKKQGTLADIAADVLGRAFDVFLRANFESKGGLGIYLTPAPVKQAMLAMAFHDIKRSTEDAAKLVAHDMGRPAFRFCDPACGSGGFLSVALNQLRRTLDELSGRRTATEDDRRKLFAEMCEHSFVGADSSPQMVMLARVNMALLGAPKARIFYTQNSLTSPQLEPGSFDLICTNPPFGTPKFSKSQDTAKKSHEEAMQAILATYRSDLEPRTGRGGGYDYSPTVTGLAMGGSPNSKGVWREASTNTDPAVLFLDRCLQLLKPGGRLLIVLPDGVLCNSSDRYVREYIMGVKDEATGEFHGGKAIVKAVLSLPSDAFKLSGTGAKTSVLYLQKRHARKDDPEKFQDEPQTDVFMAVAETLGYVVKNNVEDYSAGVPNDLAAIVGAYVRGE
ncbi:type I restriction enzyme M protein [Azospirillum brasilense]|uniref:Type I restriction enzyme M protein n=1 Tax=Azospirillum brasilense TaxID=192 RepID=A0A560CJR6_AZOBR|nr:N-6 DNA methylase [Azospirillum brasilense]TWA85132.1 type I restriction enzyme M protein [Azospirillum brasilense]